MSEKLTIVDWAGVISGVSAAVAAIMSLVVVLQNRKANQNMDLERRVLVKPIFIVRNTFENRREKEIDFSIKNTGYNKLQDISVIWKGSEGIAIKIINVYESKNEDYIIKMDYSNYKKEKENIQGKLILVYKNILGKQYMENINIFIEKKYYEITDEYNPELKKVIGEHFS